jgi:TRAP-type transport system small permease protein
MASFKSALDRLASALQATIVALAVTMLLALSLQVFMRFVMGKALSWSEELALGCFSWVMLLSIALGVRHSIHVRMDLLIDRLPSALRHRTNQFIWILIAALGMFTTWSGINYVRDSFGTTSAAIGYPIAWLYASAPVCGFLIFIFALEHVLVDKPELSPS